LYDAFEVKNIVADCMECAVFLRNILAACWRATFYSYL